MLLKSFLLSATLLPVPALAAVLYDGSSLPSGQGWTTFPPSIPHTFANPGVTLNTSVAGALQGGFAYDTPDGLLSAASGFTLTFASALQFETHNNPDRSGFTAIVVTDSLDAIELDFRTDQIYAQSFAFTAAESVAFVTSPLTTYTLAVSGGSYTLSANSALLLSGPLRRYADNTENPIGAAYYTVPGSLFFGDNTTNAGGLSLLTNVTATAVPEPAGPLFLALTVPALLRRKR